MYGVSTATGSAIDSNDIVGMTEEPDPTTGLPSSAYATTVTVDAGGDVMISTDPNGTTHTYTYDVLGQETLDTATTLGNNINSSVTAIGTTYTTEGDPALITSYGPSGDIVNQVEFVYNGLDQLTQEYESVSGAVNTATTPGEEKVAGLFFLRTLLLSRTTAGPKRALQSQLPPRIRCPRCLTKWTDKPRSPRLCGRCVFGRWLD